MCTLFHWDYPQALYKRGGWLSRDSAELVRRLRRAGGGQAGRSREGTGSPRTSRSASSAWACATVPTRPGDKLKDPQYLTAAHNALRAHGKAVQALRAHGKPGTKVGYVLATQLTQPAARAGGHRGGALGGVRRARAGPVEQQLVDGPGGARALPRGRRDPLRQGHAEVPRRAISTR